MLFHCVLIYIYKVQPWISVWHIVITTSCQAVALDLTLLLSRASIAQENQLNFKVWFTNNWDFSKLRLASSENSSLYMSNDGFLAALGFLLFFSKHFLLHLSSEEDLAKTLKSEKLCPRYPKPTPLEHPIPYLKAALEKVSISQLQITPPKTLISHKSHFKTFFRISE